MKILSNQNGFTYILALTVVMIMGIMLCMVGQSWKSIKQRELEDEVIFRGDQVAELVYQKLLCKNAILTQNTVNQFLWTINIPQGDNTGRPGNRQARGLCERDYQKIPSQAVGSH